MTRDEILNMPAGTRIKQLIWWKVFDMRPEPPNNDMLLLPDYSGDVNCAMAVIDSLNPFDFELMRDEKKQWSCSIWMRGVDSYHPVYSDAETAPLAICRAALLAVTEGAIHE